MHGCFGCTLELVFMVSLNFSQSAKMTCRGEYVRVKKSNLPCQKDLQAISEVITSLGTLAYQTRTLCFLFISLSRFLLICFLQRTYNINVEHILEPNCPVDDKAREYRKDDRRILQEKYREVLLYPLRVLQFGCRVHNS